MFKITTNSKEVLAKLERDLRSKMDLVLSSEDFLREVGTFASERIRYQARAAKPLNVSESLPGLKSSTITNREYLSQFNDTHQTYAPARSNLTLTGQLLDSIKYKILGKGLLAIEFVGNHLGYKTGSGGRGPSIKNSQIAEYLNQKGFVVFDKSLKDNKAFRARIKSIALRYVRRGLAVSRRLLP